MRRRMRIDGVAFRFSIAAGHALDADAAALLRRILFRFIGEPQIDEEADHGNGEDYESEEA